MKRIDDAENVSPADKELLAEVKRIIAGFLPDATVLVYGSTARGDRRPGSDYDILVMTNRTLTTAEQDAIRDAVFDLQFEREVLVCTMFYSPEEWNEPVTVGSPFRANVEREALVL